MRSFSSIPSDLMKLMIGGIVDSPTPIVPISADSTSRMRQLRLRSDLLKAAAHIHPADPPPTMTMVRIGSTATLSEISHHGMPERAAKSAQVVRVAGWKWRDEHPAMLPRTRAPPKHGLMDFDDWSPVRRRTEW
jgi:hypothetical protein